MGTSPHVIFAIRRKPADGNELQYAYGYIENGLGATWPSRMVTNSIAFVVVASAHTS